MSPQSVCKVTDWKDGWFVRRMDTEVYSREITILVDKLKRRIRHTHTIVLFTNCFCKLAVKQSRVVDVSRNELGLIFHFYLVDIFRNKVCYSNLSLNLQSCSVAKIG